MSGIHTFTTNGVAHSVLLELQLARAEARKAKVQKDAVAAYRTGYQDGQRAGKRGKK